MNKKKKKKKERKKKRTGRKRHSYPFNITIRPMRRARADGLVKMSRGQFGGLAKAQHSRALKLRLGDWTLSHRC